MSDVVKDLLIYAIGRKLGALDAFSLKGNILLERNFSAVTYE